MDLLWLSFLAVGLFAAPSPAQVPSLSNKPPLSDILGSQSSNKTAEEAQILAGVACALSGQLCPPPLAPSPSRSSPSGYAPGKALNILLHGSIRLECLISSLSIFSRGAILLFKNAYSNGQIWIACALVGKKRIQALRYIKYLNPVSYNLSITSLLTVPDRFDSFSYFRSAGAREWGLLLSFAQNKAYIPGNTNPNTN